MVLQLYNKEINSMFRLLGKNEDALTKGLGYLMGMNTELLVSVLKKMNVLEPIQGKKYNNDFKGCSVNLQGSLQNERDKEENYNHPKDEINIDKGRRDITIETTNKKYRIVIEAKIDGSFPTKKQLFKYCLNKKEIEKWREYDKKVIVVLTRAQVHLKYYDELIENLNKIDLSIEIKCVQWWDILMHFDKLTDEQIIVDKDKNKQSNKYYFNNLIKEYKNFIRKDYEMEYFEYEIICRYMNRESYKIANNDEYKYGYYFDGANRNYAKCLFFMACYGPSPNSKKRTAEYLRKIEFSKKMSIKDILNSEDEGIKELFKRNQKISEDSNVEYHVFKLGSRIPIPKEKQKRPIGGKWFYQFKLGELLGE